MEQNKKTPFRMSWGPTQKNNLEGKKKKIHELAICLCPPSFLFSSLFCPSVSYGYSGLSFELQLFKKQILH